MTTPEQLDAFLDELDRTNLADLEVLALPEPDPEPRAALLARVAEAARAGGAGGPLDVEGTRGRGRGLMLRRPAWGGYRPPRAGPKRGAARVGIGDRARPHIPVEEAAVAAPLV